MGQGFVLRLFSPFQRRVCLEESFPSGDQLVSRLSELGMPDMDPVRCFPERSIGLDAVWTNIDVAQEKLEGFGQQGSRMVAVGRSAAA
jgi:hypothetical protein